MADTRYTLENFVIGDKSYIQANIKALKEKATNVYMVPPKFDKRLDLISNQLYGMVHLKWVLIYVNDIIDISVVKHGYNVYYPSLKDILGVLNETADFQ